MPGKALRRELRTFDECNKVAKLFLAVFFLSPGARYASFFIIKGEVEVKEPNMNGFADGAFLFLLLPNNDKACEGSK